MRRRQAATYVHTYIYMYEYVYIYIQIYQSEMQKDDTFYQAMPKKYCSPKPIFLHTSGTRLTRDPGM